MAHKFADQLKLDASNALSLATGPVDPPSEEMFRIWVWLYQSKTKAAGRGSKDWGNTPVSPTWDCPISMFPDSNQFEKGPAVGMAIAEVKKGNRREYFGWWDKVKIVD